METKKNFHLSEAVHYFRLARTVIEQEGDWQACGSLILKGLAEERKALNSGVQVINVIRQRPKTRVEFSFRS